MSHRERFALVWVVALVVVLGTYMVLIAALPGYDGFGVSTKIALLGGTLGILALAAIATQIAARSAADRPESLALDERDRLIAGRAAEAAYHVLIAGMIIVGIVMPFNNGGWEIINAALLAIAAAEIVHHGLIFAAYRRGVRA